MLDHRAISTLFAEDDLVQDYGFSWAVPPLPLVGNVPPSIFASGPGHDRPKALYIRLLRDRAANLLTVFDQAADQFTSRCLALDAFSWRDELEDFTASFLFQWILGARPDTRDVRQVYNNIFTQFAVPITKHMPWSNYSRSLVSFERLLDFVKKAPEFRAIVAMAGDEGLHDEDAIAKQITFLLGMNSFLGTQNLLKSIVGELSLHPGLCAELRKEIVAVVGSDPAKIELSSLGAMPLLDKTLREILRLHPPVFFIFGRATRDRVIDSSSGTYAISKGELVMGVIPLAHLDDAVFPEPSTFNPERFSAPDASQHLIWPRGLHDGFVSEHDRTCPGKDVAILIAKLSCIALLPRFEWKLKESPRWDRKLFALNVAAPMGPLDLEYFRRDKLR